MKAVILGAGLQGTACAFDMVKFGNFENIVLADLDIEKAKEAAQKINSPKIETVQSDLSNPEKLTQLVSGFQIAVSAAPYFLNLDIAKACLDAKVNMCDMGGNTDIVFKELALDKAAKSAGICIVPDCGLAPGLANIIAGFGIDQFDEADTAKIRVGGLPQIKKPPLDYKLVFSAYGLLNEYSGTSYVLRNGEIVEVEALTELETLSFPDIGECEAFHTSGGISTMPWGYKNKVKELDYKTIRYPGHLEKILVLRDLGLMDTGPVRIKDKDIQPRDVLAHLLTAKLDFPKDKDLIIMQIKITGKKDGKKSVLTFDMLDYYDKENNITAMMRTTAYPVSITAQMIVQGKIKEKGALPPEKCVPAEELIGELVKRNIKITKTFETLED